VIEITPFHFDLLELRNWVDRDLYTGRLVSIPNGKVFNYSNSNSSSGYKSIWNELKVRVTFESDWKEAKEILLSLQRIIVTTKTHKPLMMLTKHSEHA
jgi:small-conductance mechanosensitive channel